MLVKNPAGANEVLRTSRSSPDPTTCSGFSTTASRTDVTSPGSGTPTSSSWRGRSELHLLGHPRRRAGPAPEVRGRARRADRRRAGPRARRRARRRRSPQRSRAALRPAHLHRHARASRAARQARGGRQRMGLRGAASTRGGRPPPPSCGTSSSAAPTGPTSSCGGPWRRPLPPADPGRRAGTGRVCLELARAGRELIAVDRDDELLAALSAQARRVDVKTVHGDARELELGRPQVWPLHRGRCRRSSCSATATGASSFLERARAHMRPGGLIACAIVTDAEPYDCRADGPGPRA